MGAIQNAALIERALRDGFLGQDQAVLDASFAPDMVWLEPGSNPLSGTYKGREEIYGLFGKLMSLTGGTFRPVPTDITASDRHAVLLARTAGTREGRSLDIDEAVSFEIRDGRVLEARHMVYDLDAWDEFWS